ncbi:hypothetical protein M0R45_029188 [Rubus argutus]|uniref:Uncharacterized protein n=1 Tax=Rubus argutus TaxID=59490 RepID=A0AAW1WAY1_RUBAR
MENSVASLEDFEFLEFEESDQELVGLSHCEYIDASDGIGFDWLFVTDSISHIRRHHNRLVRVLDLTFETHLNYECLPGHDDDDDDDDDDEGEDDDGYGLDDELVPWSVSDKFGRQRMRKLGNRKRSPHLIARPGCVRGKHGLGVKHIY